MYLANKIETKKKMPNASQPSTPKDTIANRTEKSKKS